MPRNNLPLRPHNLLFSFFTYIKMTCSNNSSILKLRGSPKELHLPLLCSKDIETPVPNACGAEFISETEVAILRVAVVT
jgi:hypothetical protein